MGTIMKRDLDLIRRVVLFLEGACDGRSLPKGAAIAAELQVEERTVNYHLKLLYEAGLVETDGGTPHYPKTHQDTVPDLVLVSGLTNVGHNFAEATRDDSRWKRFVTKSLPQIASKTLDTVVQAAIASVIK